MLKYNLYKKILLNCHVHDENMRRIGESLFRLNNKLQIPLGHEMHHIRFLARHRGFPHCFYN